jgi:DNA-binding LytR/AlgR family response regulator
MEIKALIIDDEPLARNVIREYAKNIPSLIIAGECADAVCASQFLLENEVDLLFLDINMPKISGIDFLRNLKNPRLVILTTAYSEYALEGYELNIIDYLKKPFSFERFFKACLKAIEQNNLLSAVNKPLERHNQNSFIFLKSDKRTIKVNIADICYIEGLGDYIKIYTQIQKYISNLSMKKIISVLPSDKFYRIHKSFIVAIDKIESIEGNMVKINNVRLPVGNNFRNEFLQFIKTHLAE